VSIVGTYVERVLLVNESLSKSEKDAKVPFVVFAISVSIVLIMLLSAFKLVLASSKADVGT